MERARKENNRPPQPLTPTLSHPMGEGACGAAVGAWALTFAGERARASPRPIGWGEGRSEGFARQIHVYGRELARMLQWASACFSSPPFSQQPRPIRHPAPTFVPDVADVPNQALVSVSVTGAVNVTCFTIEEILPGPATVLEVSGDGAYLPWLNAIRWGPYTNTVAANVSYRLGVWPASYPVDGGAWMDGQWYFSPGVTMVTVLRPGEGLIASPPPQVAMPVFTPASGADVPTNVTISCATTGAVIYYTLDGSLPTQSSMLYTGAVSLASASVIRAVAFTNGWTTSVAAVAYYGLPQAPVANAQVTRTVSTNPPSAPVVTLDVVPGTNAICVAVMETLPPGVGAVNVSAGGTYLASNNIVLWGPFIRVKCAVLKLSDRGPAGRIIRCRRSGAWTVWAAARRREQIWSSRRGQRPDTTAPSGDASIHARQRHQRADERDDFLRDTGGGRFIIRWTARCRRKARCFTRGGVSRNRQ